MMLRYHFLPEFHLENDGNPFIYKGLRDFKNRQEKLYTFRGYVSFILRRKSSPAHYENRTAKKEAAY